MKKILTIAAIFFLGYFFGDSAIRVVNVAWSEITSNAGPKLDQLGDYAKDIKIPRK